MGEFTPDERAAVIASVVGSQALAGIAVTPAEAGALLDGLAGTPLPPLAGRAGRGAGGAGVGTALEKRERATRIANSRDAPSKTDVHWLTSEAIGAWNKLDTLEAEVERLRAVERKYEALRDQIAVDAL